MNLDDIIWYFSHLPSVFTSSVCSVGQRLVTVYLELVQLELPPMSFIFHSGLHLSLPDVIDATAPSMDHPPVLQYI